MVVATMAKDAQKKVEKRWCILNVDDDDEGLAEHNINLNKIRINCVP